MLTRVDPAFDGPVILFQNIIEVLYRSMPAILVQSTLGFEPLDGWWITGVLVGVDDPRRGVVLTARKRSAAAASRLAERRRPFGGQPLTYDLSVITAEGVTTSSD